jgi:hypothetical protein
MASEVLRKESEEIASYLPVGTRRSRRYARMMQRIEAGVIGRDLSEFFRVVRS